MKQYLKMADEFDLPVLAEIQRADFSVISSPLGEVIGGFAIASHSTAAASAINSHDELVQMNQDLLAALEDAATSLETIQLRSFGEDSFLDSKPEMRSYAGYRASVVMAAIAKAKGGAA